MRALLWEKDALYASQGYAVKRADVRPSESIQFAEVGRYDPPRWRRITSRFSLSYRLVRDGFHGLVSLSDGTLIGIVPRAIVRLRAADTIFRPTSAAFRGTRPLNLAVTPANRVYFGEYFSNRERSEVHIYGSADGGATWAVVHTFPAGAVRHVHNIVYDRWGDCLWILTGDYGRECQILRAPPDFSSLDTVLADHQQARAASLVPRPEGIYFSTDTPLEPNYIYHLDRAARLSQVAPLSSSSIFGCAVQGDIFFSTMVEPSQVNADGHVRVYGRSQSGEWTSLLAWEKDRWHEALFQYGNAVLPAGNSTTGVLAVTTVAVKKADLTLTLWERESAPPAALP